jgi:hypothetical protein
MASRPGWSHGILSLLRKPLDKDAYRVLGMFAVGGVLLGATLGFMMRPRAPDTDIPRWKTALLCAVLAIPAGLLYGALYVALRQLWRQANTAKMAPVERRQAARIVLIYGMVVLVKWCVITAAISLIFHQPLFDSFGLALAVSAGLTLLGFLATWLYGRMAAGGVLLDCGPLRSPNQLLVVAVLFLILGVIMGLTSGMTSILELIGGEAPSASRLSGVVWPAILISGVPFWLVLASGRLQVREGGLWLYGNLLRWSKIRSHHWTNDATLLLRRKSLFPWSQEGALHFPPEHKQAVDELLAKHCPTRATV